MSALGDSCPSLRNAILVRGGECGGRCFRCFRCFTEGGEHGCTLTTYRGTAWQGGRVCYVWLRTPVTFGTHGGAVERHVVLNRSIPDLVWPEPEPGELEQRSGCASSDCESLPDLVSDYSTTESDYTASSDSGSDVD